MHCFYAHALARICIQFENSSKLPLKDSYPFKTTIHHSNFSQIHSTVNCSFQAITLVTGSEPPDNSESQPAAGAQSSYWLLVVFLYVAPALGSRLCHQDTWAIPHSRWCFYNLWPQEGKAYQNVSTKITPEHSMTGSPLMGNDLMQYYQCFHWRWNCDTWNRHCQGGLCALCWARQLFFELPKCFMNANQILSFIMLSHMVKFTVTASMGDSVAEANSITGARPECEG